MHGYPDRDGDEQAELEATQDAVQNTSPMR